MKHILTIITIICLFSCSHYTAQKAMSDVTKANDKFPAPVAKWVREKYPCITTTVDTIKTTKDSVVYIDCPDLPEIIHTDNTDTVTLTVEKVRTVKVPVHLPVQTIYVTKKIEDSAKIFVYANELKTSVKKADDLQIRIDTMTDKRDYWRIRFFILLGLVIIYTTLKIYSKRFSALKNLIP